MIFSYHFLPISMLEEPTSEVFSYTKNKHYTLCAERSFIDDNDKLLFIDDFLANEEAFRGVEKIIQQTNAELAGVGILIEKSFQSGHDYIVDKGYDFYSLANITSFDDGKITFAE